MIQHVQGQSYDYAFTTSGTSIGVTPIQALGQGRSMIVGTRADNSASGTIADDHGVTDTLGNTYTKKHTDVQVDEHRLTIFDGPVTTGGPTTLTFSSTGDGAARRTIACSEYSGEGGLVFKVANSGKGTGTAADSGSVDVVRHSLLFGWVGDGFDGSPYTPSPGWTERGDNSSARGSWDDRITYAGGTFSFQPTLNASNPWTAIIGVWEEVTPTFVAAGNERFKKKRKPRPISGVNLLGLLDIKRWF